jgi:hypothetical protein
VDHFDPGETLYEPYPPANSEVSALALQGDGKVLLAGLFTRIQGMARSRIARLHTRDVPSLPVIHLQPTNRTVFVGDEARFRVSVASDVPATYQWQFDDRDIFGATNAVLALNDVQFNHVGTYRVIVSNPLGQVTSQSVTLTVVPHGPLGNWTFRRQSLRSRPPNAYGFLPTRSVPVSM